jgi:glyoxylase-like metal-dependent hydrolase (beta-lactamase superfamily II)
VSDFIQIISLACGTRLTLKAGCVLLRDGGVTILVDPGQFASRRELDAALMARAAITLADVDMVYFTHLHFDHYDDLGFANVPAVVMPQREVAEVVALMRLRHDTAAYEHRIRDSHEVLAGIFLRQFLRLKDDPRYDFDNVSFASRLRTVLPGERLTPHITTVDLPGHCIGQLGLQLPTQWGNTLIAADAVLSLQDYGAASFDHHLVVQHRASMQATRKRLAGYDCIVPGHGEWFCPATALPVSTQKELSHA